MKNLILIIVALSFLHLSSCKKSPSKPQSMEPGSDYFETHSYSSVTDFLFQHSPSIDIYSIDAGTGGSFTTSQGTIVTIPGNAFKDVSGNLISGTVQIHFKDLYKKDDMFFSGMDTRALGGRLLVSAGEFYVNAFQGTNILQQAGNRQIEIYQPASATTSASLNMGAFQLEPDTLGGGWTGSQVNSVINGLDTLDAKYFVFQLNYLNAIWSSSNWYNSDNYYLFSNHQNVELRGIPAQDPVEYGTQYWLFIKDFNAIIKTYYGTGAFAYKYAPKGLKAHIVAVGVKDQKLYASFIPIDIDQDKDVAFSLQEITTMEFKEKLKSLN